MASSAGILSKMNLTYKYYGDDVDDDFLKLRENNVTFPKIDAVFSIGSGIVGTIMDRLKEWSVIWHSGYWLPRHFFIGNQTLDFWTYNGAEDEQFDYYQVNQCYYDMYSMLMN